MRDDSNDVDDAFQATFLILVRKAQSIRNHGSLGIWLYGVAHRVALKATHAAARRRGDEGRRAEMTSERVRDREHDDIEPMLLDEVNRLSEKYRAAIVLCCLEGLMTHETAARHLEWAARDEGVPYRRDLLVLMCQYFTTGRII